MAVYQQELSSLPQQELRRLVNSYYVPGGKSIDPLKRITDWLTPENNRPPPRIYIEDSTPKELRHPSVPYTTTDTLLTSETLSAYTDGLLSSVTEFAKWPVQKVWRDQNSPWDLLYGYSRTADKKAYFERITRKSFDAFLNDKERMFFLTRGYGRPNRFISPTDLALRELLIGSVPTALVPLMDVLSICPKRQEPTVILNALTDFPLRSIDAFHIDTVVAINRCLSSPSRVGTNEACLRRLLKTLGVLDKVSYDPKRNVYVSSLSQLGLYRDVLPDSVFDSVSVKDLPDVFITSLLRTLPDSQLVEITGEEALRERLLREAEKVLTERRHSLLEDGTVTYGRLVDTSPLIMSRDSIVESVLSYGSFIDPYENLIDPAFVADWPELQLIPEQIVAAVQRNALYVSHLTPEQRGRLAGTFQRSLREGIDLNELRSVIYEEGELAKSLLLYGPGFTSIEFEAWFENYRGTLMEIFRSTLLYYTQTLTN